MSTLATPLSPQAAYTDEPVFRLSVEQYHDLINSGKLTPDDPVELLEGILVFKMPRKPKHSNVTRRAQKVIGDALSEGWDYRTQEPLTLADGEPEPDGAVVRGTFQDYAARHPGPADVALVIEVADTTLARDRGIKLRSYARAGIPQYWIINLIDCQIETYSEPDLAALPQPTYRHRSVYDAHATVPLTIENQSVGTVSVASFFPPS